MKPIVLLDVDGVLARFVEGWLAIINEYFQTIHRPEHVTSWDVCGALGLSADESARMKRYLAERFQFAKHLRVYDGAIEGVRAIEKIADVYFVTSPWNSHPTWTFDREAWLKRHFGAHHSRVTHTSAKHLVDGDMLVDDKVETLVTWREQRFARARHPLSSVAVKWRTPHNANDEWSGRATSSWTELLGWIDEFAKSAARNAQVERTS